MTSRLKHKLELDNVNLKSAYLNESFVQIGTPLPALAETRKDQLEYVPVWKQEVRDEQGRRRLHGAFTGGWSAGYFNSVGSKEGWTPSTFKSSRTDRASKTQRPEDFMDEEDLAQMKEDRKLENTDTFRSEALGGTKEELANRSGVSAFESLIAPAKTSIGQALLQKLGWRPGQGIGPRVTLRKLRIQEAKLGKAVAKASGSGMAAEDDMDIDENLAGKHTFAPRDSRLLVFDSKDDKEGLGFEKGRGMGSLPQRKVTGPAFGVGHVDGEEDDDPYSGGGITTDKYAFDSIGDDDDVIIMGGSSGPSRHPGLGSTSRLGGQSSSSKSAPTGDRWHDGRAMLPGFTLDVRVTVPDKWFEMPDIPKDWRPRPARVWGTKKKWDETPGEKAPEKEVIRGAPGRPLTFEQRGAALGEDARISKAKSVFEYMSEKDRERLAVLALNAPPLPPPPLSTAPVEELPPSQTRSSTEVFVPPLSPRTASAALKGFVPFGDDPNKQDRYRSYLVSQCYNTKSPNPTLLPSKSIEDINKELDDFAASARIFKPMSLAMSSRFTSASASLAVSDMKQAKPGLHLFDASKAETNDKPQMAEVEVKKNLNPREQAAENGMYGKLTRVVNEFYPVKLLCKRFGVADPHPDGEPAKISTGSNSGESTFDAVPLPKNDASWTDKFIHQEGTDQGNPSPSSGSLVGILGEEKVPTTLAEVGMGEDVNQGRDTLTYTKPSIDIFKAIFASDDEDDDDDDDEPEVPATVIKITKSEPPIDPYPPADDKPVDLATFKPIFQRKTDEDVTKEKKKKKDKDKSKKRKGVLSFEVGEEGEDEAIEIRKEKKTKKEEKFAVVEDEGEWVEKPVVPKVQTKGRLGAADFM